MMKRQKLFLLLLVIAVSILSGCSTFCSHQWTDANCTMLKTCTQCGKTEGDALGHSWEEATCEVPSTCARCKETTGSALEHMWAKETEYRYDLTKTVYSICGVCGTKEVKSTSTIQTLINEQGNLFVLPAEEYMKRLDEVYNYGDDSDSRDTTSKPTYSCAWSDETSFGWGVGVDIFTEQSGETVCIASVGFLKSTEDLKSISPDEKNKPLTFDTVVLTTRRENASQTDLFSALIPACDPEVYADGLTRLFLFSEAYSEPVENSGIVYGTIKDEEYMSFLATLGPNNLFE